MYLTLPSKSLPDFYPENKILDYIVYLPKEMHFEGFWEVGLAEIIFNHSWYNIDTTIQSVHKVFRQFYKFIRKFLKML